MPKAIYSFAKKEVIGLDQWFPIIFTFSVFPDCLYWRRKNDFTLVMAAGCGVAG